MEILSDTRYSAKGTNADTRTQLKGPKGDDTRYSAKGTKRKYPLLS